MTLEKSSEIYLRYKNGLHWRGIYYANTGGALQEELGCCRETIAAARDGRPTRLGPETEAMIRRRLAIAEAAYQKWLPDSIKALTAEYRMSGDTLCKIIDREQDIMTITKNFLTGRLV